MCKEVTMENSLQHGSIWKNHTYIAKVKLPNGKNRYIYDQAEYDAYLRSQNKGSLPESASKTGHYAQKDPSATMKKDLTKKASSSTSKSLQQKTKKMEQDIDDGKSKIQSILDKYNNKEKKKSSAVSSTENSSSKKKSKSGSGSSKKSSGKKGKSSSKSKKSAEEKEAAKKAREEAKAQKQAESNAKKEAKAKEKAEKQAQKEAEKKAKEEAKALEKAKKEAAKKSSTDRVSSLTKSFKTMLGIKDKDISSYQARDGEKITSENAKELESSMISKYKNGATGYLISDSRTFRWTKTDDGLELEDIDTNEKVSITTALTGATKFSEFKLGQAKQTEEKSDTKKEDTDEYEWVSDGNGKYVKVKKK